MANYNALGKRASRAGGESQPMTPRQFALRTNELVPSLRWYFLWRCLVCIDALMIGDIDDGVFARQTRLPVATLS
jgi:hypothetical protein